MYPLKLHCRRTFLSHGEIFLVYIEINKQVIKRDICCDLSWAMYYSSAPNLYLFCPPGLGPWTHVSLAVSTVLALPVEGASEPTQEEAAPPGSPDTLWFFLLLHHCQRPLPQPHTQSMQFPTKRSATPQLMTTWKQPSQQRHHHPKASTCPTSKLILGAPTASEHLCCRGHVPHLPSNCASVLTRATCKMPCLVGLQTYPVLQGWHCLGRGPPLKLSLGRLFSALRYVLSRVVFSPS